MHHLFCMGGFHLEFGRDRKLIRLEVLLLQEPADTHHIHVLVNLRRKQLHYCLIFGRLNTNQDNTKCLSLLLQRISGSTLGYKYQIPNLGVAAIIYFWKMFFDSLTDNRKNHLKHHKLNVLDFLPKLKLNKNLFFA